MRSIYTLLLCMHLLLPALAFAQVKNPLDYPLKQYGLILGIALLGGIVSWYSKVKRGELSPFSLHHLMGELVTSALAGLLCFWLCEWAGFPPLLTAALAGVAGHMGTKAITLLEEWATKRARKALTS